ncbi:hypothetical protein PVAR5_2927 [Paecilomyces variotii No. 5]|uniref:Uncharacterized protein n=1 Tax=Byssochlamys spectabilis (strain No. 5 / NBRC 109023) TaxID=1356009 RepID=V5FQL5_BYSSN|nr:hypothetical protein PVAR5_2927 [Paecilomyces variotii No. 5]
MAPVSTRWSNINLLCVNILPQKTIGSTIRSGSHVASVVARPLGSRSTIPLSTTKLGCDRALDDFRHGPSVKKIWPLFSLSPSTAVSRNGAMETRAASTPSRLARYVWYLRVFGRSDAHRARKTLRPNGLRRGRSPSALPFYAADLGSPPSRGKGVESSDSPLSWLWEEGRLQPPARGGRVVFVLGSIPVLEALQEIMPHRSGWAAQASAIVSHYSRLSNHGSQVICSRSGLSRLTDNKLARLVGASGDPAEKSRECCHRESTAGDPIHGTDLMLPGSTEPVGEAAQELVGSLSTPAARQVSSILLPVFVRSIILIIPACDASIAGSPALSPQLFNRQRSTQRLVEDPDTKVLGAPAILLLALECSAEEPQLSTDILPRHF